MSSATFQLTIPFSLVHRPRFISVRKVQILSKHKHTHTQLTRNTVCVCQKPIHYIMELAPKAIDVNEINESYILWILKPNPIVTIEIWYFSLSYRIKCNMLNMSMTDDICLIEPTFCESSELSLSFACAKPKMYCVHNTKCSGCYIMTLYPSHILLVVAIMAAHSNNPLPTVSVYILHAIGYHIGDEA